MIKLYPLTYSQKNIWYMSRLYPDTSLGVIAGTLRLKDKTDINLLKKAINEFVKNNDGMRIQISEADCVPVQYFADFSEFDIEVIDFSEKEENDLYVWEENETKVSMHLVDSPLFYFKIIKLKNGIGGFYLKCSHLIGDAWTFTLLGSEILDNYAKLIKGEDIIQKAASYREYIDSEKEYITSEKFTKDKEYFEQLLKDIKIKTLLKNSSKNNIDASRKTFVLPEILNQRIYQYCKINRTSPFILFIAALSMYINRIANREDIILGTTILNRINKKEKETIGMFVNTSPIRIKLDDKMNFQNLTKGLGALGISLLKHQKYPFYLLREDLKQNKDFNDNLFDIVLNYQNAKFTKETSEIEYTTRWHFNGKQIESLIINVNDREDSGQLIINYDYLTSCFKEKEIEFIHKHIISLLWHAIDNNEREIAKIEMLPEEEKDRILNKFNEVEISDDLLNCEIENKDKRKTKAYILDKNLCLLPIGVLGNLYISSGDKDAIENPYTKEKIYKTGETARWYPKGDIELLNKDDERLIVPKFNMKKIKETIDIVISATFTSEPVKDSIEYFSGLFEYRANIEFAEYNQVFQQIIEPNSKINMNENGINIFLIRLEDYIRNFKGNLDDKIANIESVAGYLREVLVEYRKDTPAILGMFDSSYKIESKLREKIDEENKKIIIAIASNRNMFILKTSNIKNMYQVEEEFDETNDNTGHMPFTDEYYSALGAEILRKIIAIKKKPYKVIVLDCDNTLWKGICGEVGTYGIEISEQYKKLQEFMLAKEEEGMLLAICSKNNEQDVFDVFENNPNMLLKKENIVSFKINWEKKSENIKEIAAELNLGLDSFVFIDDSAIECLQMMEQNPQVLTLNLPV